MGKISNTALIIIIAVVIPILLIQASWIFKDAKKRGEKNYWLWGIFGLINCPESLIIYLVITRIIFKKRK
ncbi:MAG TPA: sigmaY antisigma factor component [Clostridiaceae bacterium]